MKRFCTITFVALFTSTVAQATPTFSYDIVANNGPFIQLKNFKIKMEDGTLLPASLETPYDGRSGGVNFCKVLGYQGNASGNDRHYNGITVEVPIGTKLVRVFNTGTASNPELAFGVDTTIAREVVNVVLNCFDQDQPKVQNFASRAEVAELGLSVLLDPYAVFEDGSKGDLLIPTFNSQNYADAVCLMNGYTISSGYVFRTTQKYSKRALMNEAFHEAINSSLIEAPPATSGNPDMFIDRVFCK